MPTTRNRWQAEIQNEDWLQSAVGEVDVTLTRKKSAAGDNVSNEDDHDYKLISEKQYVDNPTIKSAQDDNPRSPKRRKVSLGPNQNAEINGNSLTVNALQSVPVQAVQQETYALKASHPNLPEPVSRNTAEPSTEPSTSNAVTMRTRLENLPILSSLASQVLAVLAKTPATEALQISRNPSSNAAREYRVVRSLFDPVRKLYSTGTPFLSYQRLGLNETSQVEILRRANQAIYMSSIFTGEIGLRDMDQNFLDVFVPENGRLLKAQGSIYLELKTQAFITARRTGAPQLMVVVDDLFPKDMERRLVEKRPGAKSLVPSEHDFLKRFSSRRDIILADMRNNTLDEVPNRYRWEDFSREVSGYLAKNYDGSNNAARVSSPDTATPNATNTPAPPPPPPQTQMEGQFSIHAVPIPATTKQQISVPPPIPPQEMESPFSFLDDFVAQAARAAEIAMQGPTEIYNTPPPPTPAPQQPPSYPQVQTTFQHYKPASPDGSNTKLSPFPDNEGEIPHKSQTAPTQVLYERARQVATAKGNSMSRKQGPPSQRRPWTTEEENALMTGLDRVKGPHWSQILAMYGPGGTVNESLKDRNQVQLKDKARNLKLFFLKSGIEVPYYLKYVTGDLKTRAPAQASKQEAKERERLENQESRAHFDGLQGIMALSNGTLDTPGSSRSPTLSETFDPELDGGEFEVDGDAGPVFEPPDMADVEAMIARAAAEVSQSLNGPGWNM